MERSVFSDRMVFVKAVHEARWMTDMELSVYDAWCAAILALESALVFPILLTSPNSNYDFGCHTIPSFCGGANSDITVNEYYQYKQDIQRIKAMGVNTHSFSISWARILPFGIKGSPVSEEGLQFVRLAFLVDHFPALTWPFFSMTISLTNS